MARTCPGGLSRSVSEATAFPVRLGSSLRPRANVALAKASQRSHGYAATALVSKVPRLVLPPADLVGAKRALALGPGT
eukprot:14680950-Alexandrium_andersonii.AAC.1